MSDTLLTGAGVTFTVEFRNSAGALVDPVAVTFRLDPPGDTAATDYVYETDVELVRDSLGIYHIDATLDDGGRWRWKWTGDAVAVAQGYTDITDPEI